MRPSIYRVNLVQITPSIIRSPYWRKGVWHHETASEMPSCIAHDIAKYFPLTQVDMEVIWLAYLDEFHMSSKL